MLHLVGEIGGVLVARVGDMFGLLPHTTHSPFTYNVQHNRGGVGVALGRWGAVSTRWRRGPRWGADRRRTNRRVPSS